MSGKVDPEGMEPTTVQSGNFDERNVVVTEFDGSGGLIPSPAGTESRVTKDGPAVSADAGLKY